MIVRVDYKTGDIVIDCSGLMGMFFTSFLLGFFFREGVRFSLSILKDRSVDQVQ